MEMNMPVQAGAEAVNESETTMCSADLSTAKYSSEVKAHTTSRLVFIFEYQKSAFMQL